MTLHPIALLLPSSWTIIGAPSGNHLWQSTVFAGVVWLLTVFLRKNQAQSRYVLWLIASAKFLIPFSLLMNLGSHLPWSRTPAVAQPAVFLAMETLGEPFAPVNPTHVASLPTPSALQVVLRLLPALLLVVWFVGSLAILLVGYLRWRRLNSARRAALPLQSGRELEALRGMERAAHLRQPINLILSQSALEPGILGIFRPALLLPAGISEKINRRPAGVRHCARTVPRSPPRQSSGGSSHAGRSRFLVSSAGLVDRSAACGRRRARLRRRSGKARQ